ncbi:hypothetical protein BIZ53_00410 [Achromobacter xylosoxidans]|nr:hypothetical protein BIZ53_00410 [Achromobacter xylosoxidans]
MVFDEALQRTRSHQVAQGALSYQFRVVRNIGQAHQAAGAVFRVAIAKNHIRYSTVRQRIQHGWIVGGEQYAQGALAGYALNLLKQMVGTAGMHAIVDFLDDHQAAFGGGEHCRSDRQYAQGAVGEQGGIALVRSATKGFCQLQHHAAAWLFQERQTCNVLLGQALNETQNGGTVAGVGFLASLFIRPPAVEQHCRYVAAIALQFFV